MAVVDTPPELGDLAVALGVLNPDESINDGFFRDPAGHLASILVEETQRDALLRVVSRLFDQDGAATASPLTDGETERWVPLISGDGPGDPKTGLYAVVRVLADGAVLVGLGGVLNRVGPPDVSLAARLPLLRLATGQRAEFVVGDALGAIRVELDVELGGAGGTGDGPVPITGIGAGITIPTAPGVDPTFSARLRMPPAGSEGDIVIDSSSSVPDQLIEIVLGLLANTAGGTSAALRHLLDLIGLGSAPTIPDLSVERLVADGRDALWDWLRRLAASPTNLSAWMQILADLLGTGTVSGTATPADPVQLCVDVGPVDVCVGLTLDASGGIPVLTPTFRAAVTGPATFAPGGGGEVAAELVHIELGPSPTMTVAPSLRAFASLGVAGGPKLVDDDLAGVGPVEIDFVRAGIRVDEDGVQLVIEMVDVLIGTTSFAALDLTDPDALMDAGGAALDGVIDDVLAALGDSPAARAALVLAGIRRPDGETPATWPDLIALPDLFADPVAAVRRYHHDQLVAGRWGRLATELADLVRADPAMTVIPTGTGTAQDPWRRAVFDGSDGRVTLTAWTTDTDGTRIHIGAAISSPPIALGGTGHRMVIETDVEIISLRIAAPGDAGLDPVVIRQVGLSVGVGDDIDLDLGPIVVSFETLRAGVVWDRTTGLAPAVAADELTVRVDGFARPFQLPVWDPETRTLVFSDGVPWHLLERLAASALQSATNQIVSDVSGLLGWQAASAGLATALPVPTGAPAPGGPAVGVPAGGPVGPAAADGSGLRLEDLATDPLRAVGAWLVASLTGPAAQRQAEAVGDWLARALAGPSADARVRGIGSDALPWRIPLTSGREIEIVAAVGGGGIPLGDLGASAPRSLVDFAADAFGTFDATGFVAVVDAAARRSAAVAGLLPAGLDLELALDRFRTAIAGGDGVSSAASQHGLGGTLAVVDAGHLALPGAFRAAAHLPAGADPAGQIFVHTRIDGLTSWPGSDTDHTVDLTTDGLTAPAFDLSGITGPGPWFVVLPTRADTGSTTPSAAHGELVARLTRVVDAVRVVDPTVPLSLIAHGTAGHVARTVAADAANGVANLTTLGTPHGATDLGWMAGAEATEALRVIEGIRAVTRADAGDLAFLDSVLATVVPLLDGPPPSTTGSLVTHPFPAGEATAPPAPGTPAASVTVTCVAGVLDATLVDRGLAQLAVDLAATAAPGHTTSTGDDGPTTPDGLTLGLGAQLARGAPGPGGVSVHAEIDLRLLDIGTIADGDGDVR